MEATFNYKISFDVPEGYESMTAEEQALWLLNKDMEIRNMVRCHFSKENPTLIVEDQTIQQ